MDDLFRLHPQRMLNFFRRSIALGGFTGTCLAVPGICLLFLAGKETDPSKVSACDIVLIMFHVVRVFLYLIQVPMRIRLFCYLSFREARPRRRAVVDRLTGMVQSHMWRINHKASICLQTLYFMAMIFLIGWPSCRAEEAAGLAYRWWLYALLVANLCVFGLHMAFSCCWFAKLEADEQALFDQQLEQLIMNGDAGATGTARADRLGVDLDAHSYIVVYEPPPPQQQQEPEQEQEQEHQEQQGSPSVRSTQCMICFSDYQAGDRVRLLRCTHDGHAACLDPWLLARKPQCPLCSKDVDDPALGPLLPGNASPAPANANTTGTALPQHGLDSHNEEKLD